MLMRKCWRCWKESDESVCRLHFSPLYNTQAFFCKVISFAHFIAFCSHMFFPQCNNVLFVSFWRSAPSFFSVWTHINLFIFLWGRTVAKTQLCYVSFQDLWWSARRHKHSHCAWRASTSRCAGCYFLTVSIIEPQACFCPAAPSLLSFLCRRCWRNPQPELWPPVTALKQNPQPYHISRHEWKLNKCLV